MSQTEGKYKYIFIYQNGIFQNETGKIPEKDEIFHDVLVHLKYEDRIMKMVKRNNRLIFFSTHLTIDNKIKLIEEGEYIQKCQSSTEKIILINNDKLTISSKEKYDKITNIITPKTFIKTSDIFREISNGNSKINHTYRNMIQAWNKSSYNKITTKNTKGLLLAKIDGSWYFRYNI